MLSLVNGVGNELQVTQLVSDHGVALGKGPHVDMSIRIFWT